MGDFDDGLIEWVGDRTMQLVGPVTDSTEAVWLRVVRDGVVCDVEIKPNSEGVSVILWNNLGDSVAETWATWGEMIPGEADPPAEDGQVES